jgi:ABC-type transporter Mla MlaB component
LSETCEAQWKNARRLKLDVADVSYADRAGLTLLMALKKRGVELVNCSPFLEEELRSARSENQS